MHYETKVCKFCLVGVEHAWKAFISVSYSSNMATEEFNREISQFQQHYGEGDDNSHVDWDVKEVRQTIETDNERYTVIFGVLQSKGQRLKITKIIKIREETVVGVRLTRILCIVQKGNQFYVYNQTIAGLIPRKHKLLTDSEFVLSFSGTPVHLPEGYKFKYYENAVECWVHNNILQDLHQLHILVKANFKKFVRALERIQTRSTARTTHAWNFTEGQNVSPFESSSEEEDSVDNENCQDDEDSEDSEDCDVVNHSENDGDSENDENCEPPRDFEDYDDGKDSDKEDEDDKEEEEKSWAEEDYDADDEETSQQGPDDSDDNSSVASDGLDWLCDVNRNVCGSGFDANFERVFEVENMKDHFWGRGELSSDSLPEVCDGFRCLFGEDSDVCGDGADDAKDGDCGAFDGDFKDDVCCGELGDGSIVRCDRFLLLYGEDKDVQGDSFDCDKEGCKAVENDVGFKDDGRGHLDDDDVEGFDGFDYLFADIQNDVCGDDLENVKNSLEYEDEFGANDSFEDHGDFEDENDDEIGGLGCFSGEDDDVCDDGVDVSHVKHVPKVKNGFDSDDVEKKEEIKKNFQSDDCGPARRDAKELYVENKIENENTMKDEGKEKKQNGWNCGKILRVFVKGFLYFCNFNY